jgi:hypothetical protein
MDEFSNDIIKKSIRWKMKEMIKLKKLPYSESEEERRKKVRLKENILKCKYNFDRFIYNLGKTTSNVEKNYIKWQESHDEYSAWNPEEEHHNDEFDWNDACKPSTEKDPSSPLGLNLTLGEELR